MYISIKSGFFKSSAMMMILFAAHISSVQASGYAVYAAYASDDLSQRCLLAQHASCTINDVQQASYESALSDYLSQSDTMFNDEFGELLSVGEYQLFASAAEFTENDQHQAYFEYTINWRGIPIFETLIELAVEDHATGKSLLVTESLAILSSQLLEEGALSSYYLFEKLDASNYDDDLQLPESVNSFSLQHRSLQADPTQGVVVRYTHDDFPSAIIDIFVYPVLDHSFAQRPQAVLEEEINKDKQLIELVAKSRDIDALSISPTHIVQVDNNDNTVDGVHFEALAVDSNEPLHTTQYLFIKEDKFVKFSANVPDQFAKPMMNQIMKSLSVPKPTKIMQALREVHRQITLANDRALQVTTQQTLADDTVGS